MAEKNLQELYSKNLLEAQRLHKEINKFNQVPEIVSAVEKFYNYIKSIIPDYYVDNKLLFIDYDLIKEETIRMEFFLKRLNILEVEADFSYDLEHRSNFDLTHYSSEEAILDEIVYLTRKYIVNTWASDKKDLSSVDLISKCVPISSITETFAKSFNLPVEKVKIEAGFRKNSDLFKGSGYHFFVIVTINKQKYLIDCSYGQYFYLRLNNLARMGILDASGCFPGIYMTMTDARRKVAEDILTKGWIIATEENLKHYFDGFALSFRNALYYENLGKVDYQTNYTYEDYERFIYGDDDQVKREGRDVLGKQKRLLKNYDLDFNKWR